jgi:anti-sigma regulatory factor (Ser/Thr protein kinase)
LSGGDMPAYFPFEREITLPADKAELVRLLDWVEAALEDHQCHGKIRNQIAVVTEEIFVNIAAYAYRDQGGPGRCVTIRFCFTGTIVAMQFEDSGLAFNPLEQEMPDTTASLEDRKIGGLGILLTRKLMDKIFYKRENEKNILTLYKNVLEGEIGESDGNQ